jgi:hypothetical protein
LAVAVAFLVVIPEGDLLLSLLFAFAVILSVAKDPEELNEPQPPDIFSPKL